MRAMLRRFRDWRARRRRALEAAADEWIERHGRFAGQFARLRSIDAFMLGDYDEQERWGQIREMIDEQNRGPGGAKGAPSPIRYPANDTLD